MAVQRRRILLADDEPRIRDSVRMNLEIEGFDVFEAGNGVEALDKLRLVMPDVVVLDVMMPEMDGFEVLRELRRFSTVPVIMLTVKADERLSIDFERREVIVDGQKVQLRPTEYRLLYHLASNPGAVLSHETLLSRVWGPEYRDASHYLRLYVNYLRQKIEQDPSNPRYILTERGVGYRFVDYDRDL